MHKAWRVLALAVLMNAAVSHLTWAQRIDATGAASVKVNGSVQATNGSVQAPLVAIQGFRQVLQETSGTTGQWFLQTLFPSLDWPQQHRQAQGAGQLFFSLDGGGGSIFE